MDIAVGDIVELKKAVKKRVREVPTGSHGMVTRTTPSVKMLTVQAMSERLDGTGPGGIIQVDIFAGDVIIRHRQRTLEEIEK